MTRSIVNEPDQENHTDLPVQRGSIPRDTVKSAKNMTSQINGTLTTRYGRAVKLIHAPEDNQLLKSMKMPKESQVTVSTTAATGNHDTPENGVNVKTEKPDIKIEATVDDKIDIKLESPSATVESETLDTKEGIVKEESFVDHLTVTRHWTVGQLAWAHVSNYPYWPCIITNDPLEGIHIKEKPFGKFRVRRMVHVQYFGDNGRRNWVHETALMEYEGVQAFNKLANNILSIRKKGSKYYSGYVVKTTVRKKWDTAVNECEALYPLTVEERFKAIAPKRKRGRPRLSQESVAKKPKLDDSVGRSTLDDSTRRLKTEDSAKKSKSDESAKQLKSSDTVKKSKHEDSAKKSKVDESVKKLRSDDSAKKAKSDDSGKKSKSDDSAKKLKISESATIPKPNDSAKRKSIDDDLEAIKLRSKAFEDDKDITLTTETPPTPPSSHKDSSDEASIIRKNPKRKKESSSDSSDESTVVRKYPKRKRESKGDFETYYKSNKDNGDLVPLDSTEAHIRKYLKKVWDGMSMASPNKHKRRAVNGVRKEKEKSSDPEESPEEPSKLRKSKGNRDIERFDTSLDSTKRGKPNNIFRGMRPERVCQICEKTGNLTRCKGPCYSYFHLPCVKPGESESECEMDEETNDSASTVSGEKKIKYEELKKEETNEDENFKCIDCLSGVAPACFICNEREDDRIRCQMAACGKHYHTKCLKSWPQSHWHGGRLTCPYHMCHTCISDNPQNHHSRTPNDKLARCVRCPSAYHPSASCLPAGSQVLTGTQIVCPKHYVAPHPPLNAAWCFLCTRGGSLICCDTCPTSFHPECLGIDAPDGAFICEDCETGRLPLYGEVVWVKLGNYRWWPSRICFPHEIPTNLTAVAHSPGEFCVMFLGTMNYYWTHRGRVFLYQDGDSCAKATAKKKYVDEAYRQAVQEANELHQRLKTQRVAARDDETKNLRPPPYVKLKVNKPVGNVKPAEVDSMVACECDANWEKPCSADSDCLNRILSIECNPSICPAGSKCNNQSFVRRTYPAMEPFHTAGRGWGLKTLEPIKNGQFVIEYVGEVIDEAEYKRRLNRKKELRNENYYFLTIDNYRTIDAEPKGNLSRFMNHSCQPNCETQKWTVNGDTRIGLFALCDIKSGEELTFNYNLATEGETKKPCLCGAPNCSGYIGLKAQKPQLSVVQQTKIEKAEKVKRQRRKNSKKLYNCWTCGKVVSLEDEVQCGMKSCYKKYHRACLKSTTASGTFRCPWHHCIECDRRTSARCLLCSTAYCQNHLDGKLIERKDKNGYLCRAHENALPAEDPQVVLIDDDDIKSLTPEKEDSDEDFDTASLLADSDSPIRDDEDYPPRVSIVEVDLSSGASDDSAPEEDIDGTLNDVKVKEEDTNESPVVRKKRLSSESLTRRQ